MSELSEFRVVSPTQAYELGKERRLKVFTKFINERLVVKAPIEEEIAVPLLLSDLEPTIEEMKALKQMYEKLGWKVLIQPMEILIFTK